MNKREVKLYIESYLKSYHIPYRPLNNNGNICSIEDINTLYLFFNLHSIGGVEEDLNFYSDSIYIRSYFSKEVADMACSYSNKSALLTLINHINANVQFNHLISVPRLYLSTDGHNDIALSCSIPYDVFSIGPIECCEFITGYMPEFIEKIAPYIIFLVSNRIADVNELTAAIDRRIEEGWV